MIIINTIWLIVCFILFIFSIYFSIKLKFPQFKFKNMFLVLFNKDRTNGINSIDTLFMSLASKIGIGSLAGIAFAIYYGGIGTLFWIWISSIFIAIFSYMENYLAILYKEKDGLYYKGGPAYYIKHGLNNNKLSYIYAIILIITYILGFLTIQNNTITKLVYEMYNIPLYIVSFIITVLSLYFIFKGLKSISNLCNKIVPFMSIIYLIMGIIILIINGNSIFLFFKDVIYNAFNYKSLIGGFLSCLVIGMQKSLFASEAGLGTGAIASGSSCCHNPKQQGYIGIISTYFINILVATITGFIIYFSNYKEQIFTNLNGIELTKFAFNYHLGYFGEVMLLILIILFAFSTIVTGYYYAESNLKVMTNSSKLIFILKIITSIFLFIGGIASSLFIWNTTNFFVIILFLINLYAIGRLFNKIK